MFEPYKILKPFYRSLGFRLFVFIGVSLILLLGIGNWYASRLQEQQLDREVLVEMDNMADMVRLITKIHMLEKDKPDIQATIDDIVRNNRDVGAIRIFDKEGITKRTTVAGEEGKKLERGSDRCAVCHAGADAPQNAKDERLVRVAPSETGAGREARFYYAALNEEGCGGRCHESHSDGRRVLGVFEITMPLKEADDRIAAKRRHLAMFSAAFFLLIMAILTATLFHYYIRPINALLNGIRSISRDDFDREIPVYRKDEFGWLARSLNNMVKNLDRQIAYHELLMYDSIAHGREEGGDGEPGSPRPSLGPGREVGATFEDIYMRIQDETHLKLVRSVKLASLGQLSAGIAHEINNPLTAVLSYSSLLLEKAQTEKDKRWLEVIVSEAKRCRNIVAGLLEFARQSPPEKMVSQVNGIIERAISLVEHKESFHNIAIKQSLDPDLPRAKIDREQIYQVLTNLIINAGDAMEGKGTLTVGSRIHTIESNVSNSRHFIEISIEDTGCGIPQQNLERIFDPFFTTKGPTVGTGLGLSICFGIIKRHGGNIAVHSAPGEGSTFTIHLPAEREDTDGQD
ncbi:MAG: ATP-binding protein [Pseudomonadota bacterium]